MLLIGLVVVVAVWGGGLYQEYRALPGIAEKMVREQIRGQIKPEQIEDIRIGVARAIAEHWRQTHPPGGFPGYLKWMATSQPMELPYVVKEGTYAYQDWQQGAGFVFRVAVSLALLIFSILSQFLGLSYAPVPFGNIPSAPEGPSAHTT